MCSAFHESNWFTASGQSLWELEDNFSPDLLLLLSVNALLHSSSGFLCLSLM